MTSKLIVIAADGEAECPGVTFIFPINHPPSIGLLITHFPPRCIFASDPLSRRHQDPVLSGIFPQRGPKAGGTSLTIRGRRLRTGHPSEVSVLIGGVPCMV